MDEDLEPRPKPETVKLEAMSIAALEDYVAELEAEIARARATIEEKRKAKEAASSVFKL